MVAPTMERENSFPLEEIQRDNPASASGSMLGGARGMRIEAAAGADVESGGAAAASAPG